jgi:hypothetical protein
MSIEIDIQADKLDDLITAVETLSGAFEGF